MDITSDEFDGYLWLHRTVKKLIDAARTEHGWETSRISNDSMDNLAAASQEITDGANW